MDFEIDDEIISEFFAEFNEAYDLIVNTLVQLESAPTDDDLINELFRNIHSIKSNLRMVGLARTSDLVHVLENTFDDIRHKRVAYDHTLSDVFLLTMDKVKLAADCDFKEVELPFDIPAVEQAIARINTSSSDQERAKYIGEAILCLDPSVKVDEHLSTAREEHKQSTSVEQDLVFFKSLAYPLDHRNDYWEGRTERILDLALKMNAYKENPVDITQLTAAVYMHDFGMAFLPLSILQTPEPLPEDMLTHIKHHPIDAYLMLRRMSPNGEWELAAEICWQHQEWVDGSGYPRGIKEDEIVDGAKILAIADTFESMTHAQAIMTNRKRPQMRAIMEINRNASTQFAEDWVTVFNEVIKSTKG